MYLDSVDSTGNHVEVRSLVPVPLQQIDSAPKISAGVITF